MIASVNREKVNVCNAGCRDAFRCDRNCGLIYGPFKIGDNFVNVGEFSIQTKTCAYCGASTVQSPKAATA